MIGPEGGKAIGEAMKDNFRFKELSFYGRTFYFFKLQHNAHEIQLDTMELRQLGMH